MLELKLRTKFVKLILSQCVFFFNFIYLFLERGEGREKEAERKIDQLPLLCTDPDLGTEHATQTCAPMGIEPVMFHLEE